MSFICIVANGNRAGVSRLKKKRFGSTEEHKIRGMQDCIMIDFDAADRLILELKFETP